MASLALYLMTTLQISFMLCITYNLTELALFLLQPYYPVLGPASTVQPSSFYYNQPTAYHPNTNVSTLVNAEEGDLLRWLDDRTRILNKNTISSRLHNLIQEFVEKWNVF